MEAKRACSAEEEMDERDPRLPTTPGALGGSCRLTMRQSDSASQETRYHLPSETQNYVKSRGAWRVLTRMHGATHLGGGGGGLYADPSKEHTQSCHGRSVVANVTLYKIIKLDRK